MGWYERLRYRRFRLLYAVTRWRGFSSYLRHSCHGSSKINLHGTEAKAKAVQFLSAAASWDPDNAMAAQQMQQLSPSEQGVLLGIMVGQGPEQEQLPLEVKWVVVPPAVGEAAGAAPSVVRQLHAILDSELAVSHVPSFLATSTEGVQQECEKRHELWYPDMVPLPSYPAAPALPDALSKVHTANPSTVKAACLAAAFSFPGMELLVDVVAAAARDSPEAAVLDIDLRGEDVLEVVKASPAWANEDVFSNYPSWALLAATSNASTLWGLQLGTREAVPLLNTLFGAAPKVWRLQVAPVVERVTQWATWQRTQAALAGGDPAAGVVASAAPLEMRAGLAPPEDPLRYDDPRLTTIKFLPEEQQTRLAYVTNRQASKKFEEDLMAWGPDLHKQHPRHTFQLAFNARWWAGDVEVVRRDRGAWHIATSAMRAVKQHGVAFEYKEIIIHLYRAEVQHLITGFSEREETPSSPLGMLTDWAKEDNLAALPNNLRELFLGRGELSFLKVGPIWDGVDRSPPNGAAVAASTEPTLAAAEGAPPGTVVLDVEKMVEAVAVWQAWHAPLWDTRQAAKVGALAGQCRKRQLEEEAGEILHDCGVQLHKRRRRHSRNRKPRHSQGASEGPGSAEAVTPQPRQGQLGSDPPTPDWDGMFESEEEERYGIAST